MRGWGKNHKPCSFLLFLNLLHCQRSVTNRSGFCVSSIWVLFKAEWELCWKLAQNLSPKNTILVVFWAISGPFPAPAGREVPIQPSHFPSSGRAQPSTAAAESKALSQPCKVCRPWTCFCLHGVKTKSSLQWQSSPLPSHLFLQCPFVSGWRKKLWCPEASSSKSVSFCKMFWLQWNIIYFLLQNALYKHLWQPSNRN